MILPRTQNWRGTAIAHRLCRLIWKILHQGIRYEERGPAVSADTALLLEALTGWDAQIWLTLQAKWDLWHAMRARGNRPKVRPLRKTA